MFDRYGRPLRRPGIVRKGAVQKKDSPMRLALTSLFIALSLTLAGAAVAMDKENTLYIDLKDGRVVIEMRPDLAPNHVKRIKELARAGKYDGVVFHRVIEGFMAQTGDPTGTGTGGMGEPLKAEFSKEPHNRGAVSMARTNDPNSARSQFFIVFKDSNFLDSQYTVWGKVVSGMEHVDKIKRGAPGSGAVSPPPDKMIKVQVAADAKD